MPSRPTAAKIVYGVFAAADTLLVGRNTTRARRLRYLTKPLLMPALTSLATATPNRCDGLRRVPS